MITAAQRRHVGGAYVFSPSAEIDITAKAIAKARCDLRVTRALEVKAEAAAKASLSLYAPLTFPVKAKASAKASCDVEVTRAIEAKAKAQAKASLQVAVNNGHLLSIRAKAAPKASCDVEVERRPEIRAKALPAALCDLEVTRRLQIKAKARAKAAVFQIGNLAGFVPDVEDTWVIPSGGRDWIIPDA